MSERRVRVDFEVEFSTGGGIQGRDFRLDIEGADIRDEELAARLVHDLRLSMVSAVRILDKQIVEEPHERRSAPERSPEAARGVHVDLSHTIESGMITYKGLPAPLICDHLSFEQSRAVYGPGTEFHIGRIDMVANTGTYIDTPYHRFRDGDDLARVSVDRVSGLPGVVVRPSGATGRAIDWLAFAATDVSGRAVLVQTDWDRHWRTDRYFEAHPFLTEAAAVHLRDRGAALVGIDSLNIDDTSNARRPVHTTLLAAGIPIVEHLTGLMNLPIEGFDFYAAPPKVAGMGTFPVRAHAIVRRGA